VSEQKCATGTTCSDWIVSPKRSPVWRSTADDEEEEVAGGGRRHNRFRFVSWLLTTQVRLVSPIGPRSPELIGAVCVKGRPAVRLDAEAVSRRVETLSALPSRDRNIEFAASWIDAVRDDG
jgi:hypothetical protein